jgi:hypothetical protein
LTLRISFVLQARGEDAQIFVGELTDSLSRECYSGGSASRGYVTPADEN